MEIRVTFPGGKRVDTDFGDHVIRTDQSLAHGGTGSAPEPFDLFLASLASCAGFYVLAFCQARQIPTAGVALVQRHRFSETDHRLLAVEIDVRLPPEFPEKYRTAVVRAAAGCKVKKALTAPPEITVAATQADGTPFANDAA